MEDKAVLTIEQLRARKKGIGGSDAAGICGMSKWKTAYDIYLDKTEEKKGREEFVEHLYWGNNLESAIIKRYEEDTGNSVTKFNETRSSSEYDFILANVDGIVENKRILVEAKTSRYPKKWGEAGTADIPQEYLIQCMHYMYVYDLDEAHIPVLFMGCDFKIFKFKRNIESEKSLIDIEKNFWVNNVLKRTPPILTNTEDAKKRFKISNDSEIMANGKIEADISQLSEIKEKIKTLKEEEDLVKFKIMDYMKENSVLINASGYTAATWKSSEVNRFNTVEFKKQHKDLYDKFTTKTTQRRLLIK